MYELSPSVWRILCITCKHTHDKCGLELPILKNGFQQKCTRTRKSSELNHLIEAGYITRTNKTTNIDFIHYNRHQIHECRPNRMLSSSDKLINISEMTCEPLTTMWLCDPLCSSIFAQHRGKVWNESWESLYKQACYLNNKLLNALVQSLTLQEGYRYHPQDWWGLRSSNHQHTPTTTQKLEVSLREEALMHLQFLIIPKIVQAIKYINSESPL